MDRFLFLLAAGVFLAVKWPGHLPAREPEKKEGQGRPYVERRVIEAEMQQDEDHAAWWAENEARE